MDTKQDKPKRTVRGTHAELHDPALRNILANELLVLRYQAKRMKQLGLTDYRKNLFYIREGLDTALRRVQDVQRYGLDVVYKS